MSLFYKSILIQLDKKFLERKKLMNILNTQETILKLEV